jgi:predicted aspartyl protease
LLISGNIREANLGFISAWFICESLGIEHLVNFIVDTGASKTIIGDTDAETMEINYKMIKKSQDPLRGISGKCDAYEMEKCSLFFKLVNSAHIEYLDKILIAKCRKKQMKQSLLGMDILQRFSIYFNYDTRKILLQK